MEILGQKLPDFFHSGILPLNEKVVNSTVTLQRNSTDVAHFIQFDRT